MGKGEHARVLIALEPGFFEQAKKYQAWRTCLYASAGRYRICSDIVPFGTRSVPAETADASAVVLVAPSSTQGFIGGESHLTYAYDAHNGEKLSIRIDWRVENGNTAEFMVGEGTDMAEAKPLDCGRWSTDRRQWKCTVAKDGRLYIQVVAYPSAHFTLTVRSDREGVREKR